MSLPLQALLALLAGGLISCAFAPLNWWPTALLGQALLLWLVDQVSLRRALLLGWLFGFGHFFSGVWWVVISTHVYGGASLPLALTMLGLLAAYLGLFPALSVALYRLFPAPRWAALALIWPAAWVAGELGRNLFLGGFPWFSLGYLATEVPGALKLAALIGAEGLSVVFALSGAAVLGVLWRRGLVPAVAALVVWGVVALLPPPRHWTVPEGQALKVALVQGNIRQDQKWRPDQRLPTLELYRDMTASAWPADLVIWPEVAIPMPLDMVEEYFAAQDRLATEAGGSLFFTILTYEGRRPYNTVYALGTGEGRYVKQHLVPFGEYIPTPDWMRPAFDLLNVPLPDIATGLEGDPVLRLGGTTISMSICFEDLFPLEVLRTSRQAGLLVNVTNDAWFRGSAAPAQHVQIAQLRAAESGRSLLRVANTGISAIIDPDGQLDRQLAWDTRGILRGRVRPRQGQTPYQQLGRWPVYAFLAIGLGLGLWWRRRPAGRSPG